MKAVILAGGRGTRLSEETQFRPKPLVEAAGNPLIWHVMQNFARFGISEFIVLAGYKGQMIREYFSNYWLNNSDITFDLSSQAHDVHEIRGLPWRVTVLDTGVDTNTGGRIAQIEQFVDSEFLLTYGDGVSDVNINKLIEHHNQTGAMATLTAVQPPARFGALKINEGVVTEFQEKSQAFEGWINGGFFVLKSSIFNYFKSENPIFELDILPKLARDGNLAAYKHTGFWQPVDTIRDLENLESAIKDGLLPW